MDIEELHRVVVQGFASLNDKIDSGLGGVNGRLDSVEGRLQSVEGRLHTVEGRLESVDGRLDSLEGRFDRLEAHMDAEFGRVKDALTEHGRQLKDIRAALDRKVDRDELEARH